MARKRSTQISNRDPEPTAQIHTRGFRDTALPKEYRSHTLVLGKCFYTLPPTMLGQLRRALRDDRFDTSILDLEVALSQHSQSLGGCVGFLNGFPITDSYLRPVAPLDQSDPIVARCIAEWNAAGSDTTGIGRCTDETIPTLKMPQQAYLGWLLTNPLFREELGQLLTLYPDLFDIRKIPVPSAEFLLAMLDGRSPQSMQPSTDSTACGKTAFSERWRLSSIVAPATFLPLSLQFPVPLPQLAALHSQTSGSLLYIPDIAPLPDRDELRILTENVVRQTIKREEHLAEWLGLVRAGNLGRKSLDTFANAYSLQHYVRVFYSRHGQWLARQKTKVLATIGQCLGLSSDQLRRTKELVQERLGEEWVDTAW